MNPAAAQIKIAVGQADILACIYLVGNKKRRGFRLVQDFQFESDYFYLAGRHAPVDIVPSGPDSALDGDYPLRSDLTGFRKNLSRVSRIENHLGNAPAIAQIDKDTSSKISSRRDPAEQYYLLVGIPAAEFTAVVRPLVF